MKLEGEITSIIYQNEINSYTIAEMYVDEIDGKEDNLITIVGYLPFVVEGDELKVIGKFVEHKEYGKQFKVDTFEKLMPQTLEALERYLGNGMIKGVGPATAKKIVSKFGEDTINILKLQPLKLSQVKGITKEKALEISESFVEHWEVWQIVGFLERFGIGAENSKRVYDELGVNAIEQIEANPYILIDIARRVDFKQVDKMAMDLGIAENDDKRIKSAIKYALIKITYNGHCCTLEENLIEYVRNLLGVRLEDIENSYINLVAGGEIVEEEREDGEIWVYLSNFYDTEKSIANKIIELDSTKNFKYIKNIKKELQKIELIDDILLSEKQKEAIEAVNDNNVCIITGGPGTGKTTIIKSIIEIYKAKGKKVVLCAPTGRAAKRITETTGEEASTLHRLLEIGKFDDDIFNKKQDDYQGTPIDADVVIVDEVSMVDMFLMNYLVSAIYKGTKLVLVGDSDQLPSVGPGSVLKDLIESEVITTIHLDIVFRQAAKSQIVVNAHRVNEGEYFLPKEELEEDSKQDFFVINEANQEKVLYQVLSLCTGRLQNYGNYDFFKNIQILTPTKKGMLGTKELNAYLQKALNPSAKNKKEKNANGAIYRVGDRIMQVKNNYDISWERKVSSKNSEKSTNMSISEKQKLTDEQEDEILYFNENKDSLYFNEKETSEENALYLYEENEIEDDVLYFNENEDFNKEDKIEYGIGVFNGEIGTIVAIDEFEKSVTIKFDDDKVAVYGYSDLEQIEHSYAITIHKAQGSEFDVVIMCVPRTAPILLTRNLLYTGITRAKELLVIVGDKNVTEFMINNVDSKKRNTGLKYKLINLH